MYQLLWVRQDKQGFIDMGEYDSAENAELAIPRSRLTLIEQCATEEQEHEIRMGTWEILEPE